MVVRFRPKLRQIIEESKKANDFYADLAGKSRIGYSDLLKPKRAYTQNPDRVSERDVNDIIREFSALRDDLVLWRNNRGQVMTDRGPMRYGVGPNGASDWIGYRQIVITQAMVGRTIAQFVAAEAKAPDADAPSGAQQRFTEYVNRAGGKAIVVRRRGDLDEL